MRKTPPPTPPKERRSVKKHGIIRGKLIITGWLLALLLTTYTGVNLLIWAAIITLLGAMTCLMNRYFREVAREVISMERAAMRAAIRLNELFNKNSH